MANLQADIEHLRRELAVPQRDEIERLRCELHDAEIARAEWQKMYENATHELCTENIEIRYEAAAAQAREQELLPYTEHKLRCDVRKAAGVTYPFFPTCTCGLADKLNQPPHAALDAALAKRRMRSDNLRKLQMLAQEEFERRGFDAGPQTLVLGAMEELGELAMALLLTECDDFQPSKKKLSPEWADARDPAREVGDCITYLLALCNRLGIEPEFKWL